MYELITGKIVITDRSKAEEKKRSVTREKSCTKPHDYFVKFYIRTTTVKLVEIEKRVFLCCHELQCQLPTFKF